MRGAGDRGSAIVDFTLVGGLVVVLFASVLQLALVQHVRNTCVDAAAEGARYAAQVGRTPAEGAARTTELLRASLAERYAQDVTARRVDAAGLELVEVSVRVPLPVVGLLGPGGVMRLDGHAPVEWP
ncbi:pilus assembly protein [Cellulomonas sp. zg-ZUI222]|uniref:Pilus assembly protein n=1 Tax=Cellulomonas wangleii TaxID=2816956 RepID=A0ABX8D9K3_9CELL|nr:pilus assembly protein [Cellulomonas sp. zg-ZUI22]MBO0921610.1 pilus assembly protein [Cellulomonas wangleii]MBO0925106.1 pilus assembly protein [Cellulomonas wangleii]QVI64132.1 pilus assembly protein [Cellulomonas wangleii]